MNRIINDPDHVVEDAIKGYLAAYPHFFAKTDHEKVLKHPKAPYKGKVGVVTGGGSGHEPAFLGYIG
ncbi:dihydroxyacetone kinase subunit DhaK, partial [Yersinia mollaretii]